MDIAMDTRFSSRGKYIAGAYGKADSGETTSNGKGESSSQFRISCRRTGKRHRRRQ